MKKIQFTDDKKVNKVLHFAQGVFHYSHGILDDEPLVDLMVSILKPVAGILVELPNVKDEFLEALALDDMGNYLENLILEKLQVPPRSSEIVNLPNRLPLGRIIIEIPGHPEIENDGVVTAEIYTIDNNGPSDEDYYYECKWESKGITFKSDDLADVIECMVGIIVKKLKI
jgi:hypothetical protein